MSDKRWLLCTVGIVISSNARLVRDTRALIFRLPCRKKAADQKTDGEVLSTINRLQDQYQSAKFEQHFKVDNAADDEP